MPQPLTEAPTEPLHRPAHDAVAALLAAAEARPPENSAWARAYQSGREQALREALRAVDHQRYIVRALAPFAFGWNTIDTWTGESPSHHGTEAEALAAAEALNVDNSNPSCVTCSHRDTSHSTGGARGCYQCPDFGSACGAFVPTVPQ